jgi:hypothetical protein
MALAYNARRATRDIDGVFEPKRVIYEAAARIAARHQGSVPDDWLNDAVKGYLLGEDPDATVVFQHPGLNVRVASPRYLFTMKVAASRVEQDDDDIAVLYRLSGFTSVGEALDYIAASYPHLRLEPKAEYLLEEIAAAQRVEQAGPPAGDVDKREVAVCGQVIARTRRPCILAPGHSRAPRTVPVHSPRQTPLTYPVNRLEPAGQQQRCEAHLADPLSQRFISSGASRRTKTNSP